MTLLWEEWFDAVRSNLRVERMTDAEHDTLWRWYKDGLTIQAATINMREQWKEIKDTLEANRGPDHHNDSES